MHTTISQSNLKILTFDLEDWFRIYDGLGISAMEKWESMPNLERELELICRLLEDEKIKATFFCLGREAERNPQMIRKISNLGHEIGAHSFNHFKVNTLTESHFREDASRTIYTLEEITGKKVKAYRAPGLKVTQNTFWAFETLVDLGIEVDSSLVTHQRIGRQKIPNHPFIIDYKGVKIKEFPNSSIPLFRYAFNYASSGYFRLMPYWFLQKKIVESPYIMSYFHPRDFDIQIHRLIQANLLMKLKYRIGTKSAFTKLEKLSEKVKWVSLNQAIAQMNWDVTESISFPPSDYFLP